MSNLPENTEYVGAVGALVTCEIDGKRYAILQKKAANDSFPGCLQVTVHGGLEGNNRKERESMLDGLEREHRKEVREILERSPTYSKMNRTKKEDCQMDAIGDVGGYITDQFVSGGRRLTVSKKTKIDEQSGVRTRKTDVTLGFDLNQRNEHLLPALRDLESENIIVLLSADEIDKLVPLDPKFHKEHCVTEEGKYGMFADEIEAVKKALLQ